MVPSLRHRVRHRITEGQAFGDTALGFPPRAGQYLGLDPSASLIPQPLANGAQLGRGDPSTSEVIPTPFFLRPAHSSTEELHGFKRDSSFSSNFCLTCSLGVNEVDYSRYPAREIQLQWLSYYLEAQKGTAASPREVERLYAQVNKFALVSTGTRHRLPPRAWGQFLVRVSIAMMIHHDQKQHG